MRLYDDFIPEQDMCAHHSQHGLLFPERNTLIWTKKHLNMDKYALTDFLDTYLAGTFAC